MYQLDGYDRKAPPEVFDFLGLRGRKSCWSVCRGCGFLFQNPRPTPEKIRALYEGGLYRAGREYSDHFFKMRYRNPLDHFRWFQRHVPVDGPLSVLDIGAGHGGAVRAFRDLGHHVDGIEADPDLCEQGRRRFGVDLIHGDFLTYDFPEMSYDLIYSSHTHEHFDDFLAVNRKIRQVLRPGGYLLLVLPTYRCAGRNGQGFINVFYNSIFTARSLRNMLVKSGFISIASRYPFDHSRPEVWGIGRKADRVGAEIRCDHAGFVVREIQHGPLLFEVLYRVVDPPMRVVRGFLRRLWGRSVALSRETAG